MASIDLKSLAGRLNDVCRRALDAAAGITMSRSNHNVEIEHFLLALIDRTDSDMAAILRHFEVDPGRRQADLIRGLDRLKTGNARVPSLSLDLVDMFKEAWLLASVEMADTRIRSGHLLWAALADEALSRRTREASAQFARISAEILKKEYATICADTAEAAQST